MAYRIGCNNGERDLLVATLRATGDWNEAKRAVPDVDPKVLEAGFKVWAHEQAGVELPKAAPKHDEKKPDEKKPDPLK